MEEKYEIGNFIYQLRSERGYTQKELGAMLGVTDKAVSKWETGAAAPRRAVLRKLSTILDCTQEELLLGRRIEKTTEEPETGQRVVCYEAEIDEHTEQLTALSEKLRKIIWRIELCVLLVLALLAAVVGFHRGIWDGTRFFAASQEGNKRVYTGKGNSSIEITMEAGQNQINLRAKEGQTARITFQSSQSGSSKTVLILSADGSPILSRTFFMQGGSWTARQEGSSHVIGDDIWNTDRFSPGISDQAICRMALGLDEIKMMGRGGDFVIGALFLTLGLLFRFFTKALIGLDKKVLGIFYQNTKGLRANSLAQGCLLALGVVLFAIGLLLCCNVLFS